MIRFVFALLNVTALIAGLIGAALLLWHTGRVIVREVGRRV